MPVTCQVTFPEEVAYTLGWREQTIAASLKKELAGYFFQQKLLSFGQARRLAELSVWDFLELLRERHIPLHYGIAEYEQDVQTMQEFV